MEGTEFMILGFLKPNVANKLLCKRLILERDLKCSFSPRYPYVVKQSGNENTQTNQVEVVNLIQTQFLETYLAGDV